MSKFLQGHLLVASPQLTDPNFFHTVVLLIRHNPEGALGLILNRPTSAQVGQVWSQISQAPAPPKELLHVGGPCQGPLMALHSEKEWADIEVLPDVYFTAEPGGLERLMEAAPQQVRFFVGCAGWAEGQLEGELRAGAWTTVSAASHHVFDDRLENLWERAGCEAASRTLLNALQIRHIPPDPSLN